MRRIALIIAVVIAFGTLSSSPRLAANAAQQPSSSQVVSDISPEALAQIDALLQEKASRTPAQQKMDSQLVYAVKMARGEALAAGVAQLQVALATDGTDPGRVTIDVRADVTDPLMQQLRAMNVDVISASAAYGSLRLQANLDQVEAIAALPQVIFIQSKQEALTSRVAGTIANQPIGPMGPMGIDGPARTTPLRRKLDRAALAAALQGAIAGMAGPRVPVGTGQGSRESEGDTTHRAFSARGTFHIDGTGVKIGVLSDGVTNLAASQALGDLGSVTILPGQAGSGDEGTAMLEIVHDLAPGAQLYFATAFSGITQFAQNIRDLRTAGCDIIVDDVFYFVETPFQDGQLVPTFTNAAQVIQAVKDVTAAGALYFSAAGNEGNLDAGTSGTWEGDFLDGGLVAAPLTSPADAHVHSFGPQNFDVLSLSGGNANNLYWADPLGGSSNDYDLFRLDAAGAIVLASSTNIQSGTQDPYEQISPGAAGNRLVIVKKATAAARFLHLGTIRGRLSIPTAGETHGHAAVNSANAFGVAATPAVGPFPNPFNAGNVVESFSSNGPRRSFFTNTGAPVTPGNFSSTGGIVLNKPDITAADGVSVTGVGGFPSPFFGTSAAAPHAAAIAGLIKSSNPALTAAQITAALNASAIDIQAAGFDRNSGAGIIMAYGALQSTGAAGTAFLVKDVISASENPGNSNGAIEAGEGGKISVTLANVGVNPASAISATLTSATTGITVHSPNTRAYPNIPATSGTGATAPPFTFTVASNAPCPLAASFTLTVTYTGGGSPAVIPFTVPIGPAPFTISTTLDAVAPPVNPVGGTATTGLQTSRLTRNGVGSVCSPPKANPGLLAGGTGTRQYDLYSFNSCPAAVASCATVTVTQPANIPLFTVGYVPTLTPANPSTNYAGDNGVSAPTMSYSFPVSGGGANFAVSVHEVNSNGGLGASYTLTVSGACGGACATPNGVPVAIAKNVTVKAVGGSANASIDNGSFDPNGDPLTFTQTPSGPYLLGTTTLVTLTVTDPKGASSQATGTVTVVGGTLGDFDGDGKDDPTIYRPSTGLWASLKSSTNYASSFTVSWGLSTDKPVAGDYDGDGKADPAIFRPSTGLWAILKSSTNYTTSTTLSWGLSTDLPEPGDYDGDGKTDPAIYRPSTGLWAILKSSTNYTTSTTVSWGLSTDLPVQGDYDGDGKTDPAVFRPSTGGWFVLKSSTNYTSSFGVSWGLSTDVAVPGDYDGDGKTDPAVFRPSTGGWFVLKSSTNYTSSFGVSWGLSTDNPVPADFDGDGKTDPAIFRPSTGLWAILKSSSNYTTSAVVSWGLSTDTPLYRRP